jgi:hydroxymethylpyrimidine pyrophosphatase-like HAD family hydrolase
VKGLILIDWDRTIVDDKNKINSDQFIKSIEEKINQGWEIGLNSDTPLKRLYGWWKALNMNGPIVAERGAVVWWPGDPNVNEKGHKVSNTSNLFLKFRQEIIAILTQMEKCALFFGDSTEFIKSVSQITNRDEALGIITNDTALVALDAYRESSVGMFVRRISEGKLICDLAFAEEILDVLKSKFSDYLLTLLIDFYRPECFIGISSPDDNKLKGMQFLLKHWKEPPEVIMIGDSMPDYLNLPPNFFKVRHGAVGNAEPEFRELADLKATKKYAEGCVELLSQI